MIIRGEAFVIPPGDLETAEMTLTILVPVLSQTAHKKPFAPVSH